MRKSSEEIQNFGWATKEEADKSAETVDNFNSNIRREVAQGTYNDIERRLTQNAQVDVDAAASAKKVGFAKNLYAREKGEDVSYDYLRGELSRYNTGITLGEAEIWLSGRPFIGREIRRRAQEVIDAHLNGDDYDNVSIPEKNGIMFSDFYVDPETHKADIYSDFNKMGGSGRKNKQWLARQEEFKKKRESEGKKYEFNTRDASYPIMKNNDLRYARMITFKMTFGVERGGIPRTFNGHYFWNMMKKRLTGPRMSTDDLYSMAWNDVFNKRNSSESFTVFDNTANINDLMKKRIAIYNIGQIIYRVNCAWKIGTKSEPNMSIADIVKLAFNGYQHKIQISKEVNGKQETEKVWDRDNIFRGITHLIQRVNAELKTSIDLKPETYMGLESYDDVLSAISADFCKPILEYYDNYCRVPVLDAENKTMAIFKMNGRTMEIRWILESRK